MLDETKRNTLKLALNNWAAAFQEYEKLNARYLSLANEIEQLESELAEIGSIELTENEKINRLVSELADDKEALEEANKMLKEKTEGLSFVQVVS